jgi:hypothetical protein
MADLTINSAAVSPSNQAVIERGFPGGAAIGAGMHVYKDANNRWVLFDSNVGAGAGANVTDRRGIALNNCANTQPLAVCTSDPNFGIGSTVANGVSYWGSNTAGGITATAPISGEYTVHLGVAISATRINLNPTASGVAV